VLATLSTNRTSDLVAEGASSASALTDGYKLAFLVGAGIAILAVAVAVTVLQPSPALEEEPVAEPGEHPEFAEVPEPAFSSEAA